MITRVLLAIFLVFGSLTFAGCDNPFAGDTINNYNHNGDGNDTSGNEADEDTYTSDIQNAPVTNQ
jgi:hypothetical protein